MSLVSDVFIPCYVFNWFKSTEYLTTYNKVPFHIRGITLQYLKARDITVIILSKPNISLLRFIIENINTMEHFYRKMLLLQVLVLFDYSK